MCGVGVHNNTPFRYCDSGVECYNPEIGEWSTVAPMDQCRSNHCVQALGEYICIVVSVGNALIPLTAS